MVFPILSSTLKTTFQLQQSKEEGSNWEGGMDRKEVQMSAEVIMSDNTCGTANLNAEACKTQKCTVNSHLIAAGGAEDNQEADVVAPILSSTLKTTSQLQQSKEEDSNWQGDMCQKEETNESTELLFHKILLKEPAWTPELAQHKKHCEQPIGWHWDEERHKVADMVFPILSSTLKTTFQLQQSKEEGSNWEGGMDRKEVQMSAEVIMSDNTCGTANLNAEACKTQKCTVNSHLLLLEVQRTTRSRCSRSYLE
uniref:Uncharacterized protein n=1 Tax=Ditylenchus dipsaci TaxID=166011 RepID=A0A915ERG8_9BILA